MPASSLFIGTAAWGIPSAQRSQFADGASILHRYASRLNAAEINSSFYRPHRRTTYERWAGSVGAEFRFAVKAPRSLSHERRLAGCRDQICRFVDEAGGLGSKLGAVLVQLPPSLKFEGATALPFFEMFAGLLHAPIVCEPRHKSWFSDMVDEELRRLGVARVAADPFVVPVAGEPGGSKNTVYFRLHGTPEIYASEYSEGALNDYAERLRACDKGAATWCIFDNTMQGHATANALRLTELLTAPHAS